MVETEARSLVGGAECVTMADTREGLQIRVSVKAGQIWGFIGATFAGGGMSVGAAVVLWRSTPMRSGLRNRKRLREGAAKAMDALGDVDPSEYLGMTGCGKGGRG